MDYKIMIDEFEGPMDLLLHLIKKENIDIIGLSADMVKAFKNSWKTQADFEKALESDGEVKKGEKVLKDSKTSRNTFKGVSKSNTNEAQGRGVER